MKRRIFPPNLFSLLGKWYSNWFKNRHYRVYHTCFIHVRLFATLWAVAHQAPLSMGFSRQEYWSGLPCPPPRGLPDPGIEPMSLISPALVGKFFVYCFESISNSKLKTFSWGKLSKIQAKVYSTTLFLWQKIYTWN